MERKTGKASKRAGGTATARLTARDRRELEITRRGIAELIARIPRGFGYADEPSHVFRASEES